MIIEQIVIDYLNSVLDCPAYAEEPATKNIPYVVVSQTSGGKEKNIVSAAIALDSYADTKEDALLLNNSVINKMEDFISRTNVMRSTLNTTYNATDLASKRYCYSCSFDVIYLSTD